MGGIFAGQLPSLEFYQEFLTTTEKLDQYMSSQAEYIDSYYFGKLIGDAVGNDGRLPRGGAGCRWCTGNGGKRDSRRRGDREYPGGL